MQQIVLVEDTRQQTSRHDLKHEYFDKKGIRVVRSKLFVGDYSLLTDMSVCVDTKYSVSELYSDMYHSHERFRNEADRAMANGIRLFILVENTQGFKSIDDLIQWKNPQFSKKTPKNKKRPVPNDQFIKALKTFSKRHGAIIRFVSPENSGRAVMYLLTGKDWGE